MSCSNSFGCGFLSECFFPSGRCVAVGGSCRMEEHSLLSDSPCSWHLCYPMSLFPDNVFISICFICNWDGGLDALTALSEKWQCWLPARERVRETNGTFGGYFLFVTSSTGKNGGGGGGKVGLGNVVWGQRGAVAECTTKSHFEMDALMALGLIKSLDWYCKWALYLMTSAAFLCTHPEITVSSVEPVTSPDGGIMFCSLLSNSTFIPLQNPPLGSLRQMSPQLPPLFLCLWVIHTVDSTSGGIHQA